MQNPLIKTDRLSLRDYKISDVDRVHLYAKIPEFTQYENWGPNTLEDTQKFVSEMIIQNETKPRFKFDLAICLKENDLLIGGCGIRRESETSNVANLGWAINPDFQNKGYATEAAAALVKFGLEQLNLAVIYATCDTRNTASFKVMEKIGMKRVGMIPKDKLQKGYMRDTYRYEVLNNK